MTVSNKKELDERINREVALTIDWAIDVLEEVGDIEACKKRLNDKKREMRDDVTKRRD